MPQPQQAIIAYPTVTLRLYAEQDVLLNIEFLPADTPLQATDDPFLREVERQLQAYLSQPQLRFDVPYRLRGTAHQQAVWRQIAAIAAGETLSYGELARRIGSAARAVGGACGRNPIPIIVPCHRVLAQSGLGGFNQSQSNSMLDLKRWLLHHEGVL